MGFTHYLLGKVVEDLERQIKRYCPTFFVCLSQTKTVAGARHHEQNTMKTRFFKLLFFTLFGMTLLATGCSKDESRDGDGPAGSTEMLYGTWGATSMTMSALGQTTTQEVDPSISTITFNSDGTLQEYQEGGWAYATWNYNPSSRIIRMVDSNYGGVVEFYVKSLTESQLIVQMEVTSEGMVIDVTMTYARMQGRAVMSVDASASETTALLEHLFHSIPQLKTE